MANATSTSDLSKLAAEAIANGQNVVKLPSGKAQAPAVTNDKTEAKAKVAEAKKAVTKAAKGEASKKAAPASKKAAKGKTEGRGRKALYGDAQVISFASAETKAKLAARKGKRGERSKKLKDGMTVEAYAKALGNHGRALRDLRRDVKSGLITVK